MPKFKAKNSKAQQDDAVKQRVAKQKAAAAGKNNYIYKGTR